MAKRLEVTGSPSALSASDDAGLEEARHHRRVQLLTEQAGSPAGQLAAIDYCNEEPYAEMDGGFVINHYRYCEANHYKIEHIVCVVSVFGVCLAKRKLGYAEFRLLTRSEGWDGAMPPTRPNDWVDPNLNQINWVTRLDQWSKVWGDIALFPLKVEMNCDVRFSPGPCVADPRSHETTRLVGEWMLGAEGHHRWLQDPRHGFGADAIAEFDFEIRIDFMGQVDETEGNSYRCDSAQYLLGRRGCMFHRVDLIFNGLDLARGSDTQGEAVHVWEAFYMPGVTKPSNPTKQIPGNARQPSHGPLTRLYPGQDPEGIYDANHATAVHTCSTDFPQPYTVGPNGERMDCDEFPFRATFQGASQAGWNYSAKPVFWEHNQAGGRHLGDWYTNGQRVLHKLDRFYVLLVSSGGGGGGGGGSPIPDQGPSVSAGPDVTGDEGSPILLAGSASDTEGTPAQRWAYSAGSDVDPGATCTFGNAGAAATRLTCTDDGTFTVTLTADDGVNAPVSDSAIVRVRNVAPQFDGLAAEPWAVYRVGTPVQLNGVFTDPGANDTHTCAVAWDDGAAPDVFAAQDGSCGRVRAFTQADMYTVDMTVTDDDGGAGQNQTMIIVYDPSGGFATADGHLDSPAGALPGAPAQTGRLQVQFNVKYLPGEMGPVPGGGKVNARLKGSTFELDSTAIEWLVVTADRRVAIKGVGAVNGQAGHGFVMYGDDTLDAVRLVVWPLSTGPIPGFTTVYDNVWQGGYDVGRFTPQPLTGGSVAVHR